MNNITLQPIFTKYIPKEIEDGRLYISEEFGVAIHLCACGCGSKTVTPLGPGEWTLTKSPNGSVSLSPSIGNFMGENPYHAHYFITNNIAEFC